MVASNGFPGDAEELVQQALPQCQRCWLRRGGMPSHGRGSCDTGDCKWWVAREELSEALSQDVSLGTLRTHGQACTLYWWSWWVIRYFMSYFYGYLIRQFTLLRQRLDYFPLSGISTGATLHNSLPNREVLLYMVPMNMLFRGSAIGRSSLKLQGFFTYGHIDTYMHSCMIAYMYVCTCSIYNMQ